VNFLFPEIDRRSFLTRTATAMGGLALGGGSLSAAGAAQNDLDLDDPLTNLMAMLKIRGDISGKEFFFAFPGEAWAMIPGDGNFRLFKTFGFGAGRFEEAPEGWRILSREVLYYVDPDSGEILEQWSNPFLGGRSVDVVHVSNDPINGIFTLGGRGPLAAPYPYIAYGDDIIFQWNFFIHRPAAMSRKDYPLYSSGDMDQHAELWGIQGHKSDVLNPAITSAPATISWSRVASWLPFMEMGNRPGTVVFHSHSYKLTGGVDDLPRQFRDYTEKHYPEWMGAPTEWNGPELQSSDEVFKELIDSRREAGDAAS
jgi:hypothetical protein